MRDARRRPGMSRAATAAVCFVCFVLMALMTGAASMAGFSRMNALNESTRLAAETRGNKLTLVEEMRQAVRSGQSGVQVQEAYSAARAGFEGLGMSPEERARLDDAGRATRDGGPALETALRRLDAFERMSQVREAADASELNRDAFRFALILQSMALSASLIVGAAAAWLVLRSERQLQRGKDLAQATLEGIREGVITVDAQGAVQFMNTRAESMTGWSMDDAKGRPLAEVYRLVGDEGRQPFTHPAQHPVSAPMASPDGTRLVARDGRQYEVQDSASAIRDHTRRISGAVVVFHDLTEERTLRRELAWQAMHDLLTGLKNRDEFEITLTDLLVEAGAAPSGLRHAVLFIDLDQFNVINDTCGHVGGDQLLKRVADLLREVLGPGDVAARLSGDDFAVILREVTLDEAEAVAKDIALRLRALRFTWEGRTHQVTGSIGVAEAAPGMDAVQVMSAADIACYDAKEAGRDAVRVHRAGAASESRIKDMGMVSTIQRALDEDKFVLYRQRIQGLHASNHDDVHFELLLRMVDGDGRLLSPGQFLPAAERYNLMRPIDRWVVEAVLPALARMVRDARDRGESTLPLYTINLSGASLNDAGFAKFLDAQLKNNELPPRLLCFEITETMAISNLAGAAELMHAVRAAGCRFALDDFGMGMSSFAYLKHLPVDYVKIDGAFIRNILSERIDHHIVDAIARVCGALDIKTVAEFVEEESMMPVLAELGVDYAQGYAVGRPEALP